MSRPRPRPRPRPKVTSDTSVPSTSTVSQVSARSKSPNSQEDDTDDLFRRHDPHRLETIYNQKKTREPSPVRDVKYFDGNHSDESPESKRRRREMAPKIKPLPAWTQKPRDVTAVLPKSEDDDSSGPEILDDDDLNGSAPVPLPQPRFRERSITPPPQHLQQQVGRQVKEVLRNLFDAEDDDNGDDDDCRELSPEGESQDGIQLLPELAAIQRRVRATSSAPEVPDAPSIELGVKWIRHPIQPFPFEKELTSWSFNVPLNKPFGEVRRMLVGIPSQIRPVLRWKSMILYDGGTPASLLVGSKLGVQAMSQATHEYFEERHELPSSAPGSDAEEEGEEGDGDGDSREASPAAAEKISLRLRTGPGDDRPQTLRVLADATIESVIAAFLTKTGRAGMKGVTLQLDGEDLEMDSTVADADLEDGDLVEVAGIE